MVHGVRALPIAAMGRERESETLLRRGMVEKSKYNALVMICSMRAANCSHGKREFFGYFWFRDDDNGLVLGGGERSVVQV